MAMQPNDYSGQEFDQPILIDGVPLNCFIGKDDSFKDTFGRLRWDKSSLIKTTKFLSVFNGRFIHPEKNRTISITEDATLQSFFMSQTAISRLIGNEVLPEYVNRIGSAIKKNYQNVR